jgi:hypothetical protein
MEHIKERGLLPVDFLKHGHVRLATLSKANEDAAGGALLLLLLPHKEALLAALQRTADDASSDAGNQTVLGPQLQLHASEALALMREWP